MCIGLFILVAEFVCTDKYEKYIDLDVQDIGSFLFFTLID